MKSIWKWILGIAAVLLVLAALVAAGYWWHSRAGFGFPARAMMERNWDAHERGFDQFHGPMTPAFAPGAGGGGRGVRHMMPFGGMFLFPFFGLIRLLPLALVAAGLVIAYQMGKRAGINSAANNAPPAAPAPPARKTSRRKSS